MPAGLSRFALVVIVAVIVASGVALTLRLLDARRAPPIVIVDVAAERPVIVVVDGAVSTPGVLTLPPGARLNDAILAAGGFTDSADSVEMNLARLLDDGERITVAHLPPAPAQTVPDMPVDAASPVGLAVGVESEAGTTATGTTAADVAVNRPSASLSPSPSPSPSREPTSSPATRTAVRPTPTLRTSTGVEMVDINTATIEQLDALPRIGPVLAERIVAYREDNGPFATVDDLEAIDGISAGMVDELRPLIVAEPAPR